VWTGKRIVSRPKILTSGRVFFNVKSASGRPDAECDNSFSKKERLLVKEGAGDIRYFTNNPDWFV